MKQQPDNLFPRPVPGPGDALDARRYVLEPSPRRVRVRLGGEFVADSTETQLLFETGKLPVYYFPKRDVRLELLSDSGRDGVDEVKGQTARFSLRVGGKVAEDAAWCCRGNSVAGPDLGDLIAFDWNKMDAWFEEDDEVFVHARDPYHRVDVVDSSRHVEISIEGVKVADSRRPMMLFETGLPTRFYLPKLDVRLELLEPSEGHSACPYKGTASYFGVRLEDRLFENIVWCYETPIPEIPKIAGRLCFFDEKVDVTLDGSRQVRPRTRWS